MREAVGTVFGVPMSMIRCAGAMAGIAGAIAKANASVGVVDTIYFNVPTSDLGCHAVQGWCVIAGAGDLTINEARGIDGFTQPESDDGRIPHRGRCLRRGTGWRQQRVTWAFVLESRQPTSKASTKISSKRCCHSQGPASRRFSIVASISR